MRILVTFALPGEFAPWKRMHEWSQTRVNQRAAFTVKIEGVIVMVALTGVGRGHARDTAAEFFGWSGGEFDVCITSGLAGALKSDYAVGDVLVAGGVKASHDLRAASEWSATELVSAAAAKGARSVPWFVTSSRAANTVDEKRSLSAGADAVEMESFEVMSAARAAGSAAVAIRAVSDAAEENLPLDMNRVFGADGRVSLPRVLGQVALHPGAIPGLIRLGGNSRKAAASLARFLDSYVKDLSTNRKQIETKTTRSAY
jgi:adenosylhomocysteine nucleosidase